MKAAALDFQSTPEDVIQVLDDHHLVALSDSRLARQRFRATLVEHLDSIGDTEVIGIRGDHAIDLPSFCRQLERQLAVQRRGPQTWWRDVSSVIDLLRGAASRPKRRYFVWNDADAMLRSDAGLFCRLVNALFGVAAECEHISMEPLVVQRVVFIGGEPLGTYAEDAHSQFSRWLDDDEESPFWEVASVLERPPVLAYRIGG